jgi:hypothetical protein
LARTEGLAVLRDYANWWEFDPEDRSDPAESAKLEAARSSSAGGSRGFVGLRERMEALGGGAE